MANGTKTIEVPERLIREARGFVVLPVREYNKLWERARIPATKKLGARDEVDARLDEGLADLHAGRVFGPFSTARAMVRSLRRRHRP